MTETTIQQVLDSLIENEVCDEETKEALLKSQDPFVESRVREVHTSSSGRYEKGNKLLFLEELLNEEDKVKDTVKEWLSDEDRLFLFDESPQGDLYGQLLLAKAKGNLINFRDQYSRPITEQAPFESGRTLNIKREEGINSNRSELYEGKVKAVVQGIERDLDDFFTGIKDFTSNVLPKRVKGKSVRDVSFISDDLLDGIDLDKLAKLEAVYFVDKSLEDTAEEFLDDMVEEDTTKKSRAELKSEFLKDINEKISLYENLAKEAIKERLDDYLKRGDIYAEGALDNILKALQIDDREEEFSPLRNLALQRGVSDRVRNARNLEYRVSLSDKDPLDIRFGKDSGCCIGVYPNSGSIGKAFGLPHMIADNSVYFFNVEQKKPQGEWHRVGIVLGFDGEDSLGNRVFIANSLELSPFMNPDDVVPQVVDYAESEVIQYLKSQGFKAAFMGAHDYNTSRNHSTRANNLVRTISTKKKSARAKPFYSEVFNRTGKTEDSDFYSLFDDRNN